MKRGVYYNTNLSNLSNLTNTDYIGRAPIIHSTQAQYPVNGSCRVLGPQLILRCEEVHLHYVLNCREWH